MMKHITLKRVSRRHRVRKNTLRKQVMKYEVTEKSEVQRHYSEPLPLLTSQNTRDNTEHNIKQHLK